MAPRALGGFLAVCATTALAAAACSSAGSDTYSREKLLDPKTCSECHKSYYDEWSGSMHAYASKDPVFLAMNERGQREAMLGDFCVKCHAPMALNEGVTKDGTNLDTVPDALQGVTCYFCHRVSAVHGSSNAAVTLADDATMRGRHRPGAQQGAPQRLLGALRWTILRALRSRARRSGSRSTCRITATPARKTP